MSRTPESLCSTSVADARSSLYHINDYHLVRKAYECECAHQNRVSMKDMLLAKMNRLRREQKRRKK